MSRKRLLISLLSAAVIFTSLLIPLNSFTRVSALTPWEEELQRRASLANKMWTPQQMSEDLSQLIERMKVHPKFPNLSKSDKYLRTLEEIKAEISSPMKHGTFYFVLSKMLSLLNDGHTVVSTGSNPFETQFIDLPVMWIEDQIIIKSNTNPFKLGDKIIKIGGKSEQELLEMLTSVISSDNIYYTKLQGIHTLVSKFFLDYFKLTSPDGKTEIVYERDGKQQSVSLGYINYRPAIAAGPRDKNASGYFIEKENNLGVFYLDTCFAPNNHDPLYKKYIENVDKFFEEIKSNNIQNICLDLSRNGGGLVSAIEPFMSYLSIDKFRYFDSWSYTKNIPPNDKSLIFKGKVYVMIDAGNFSAATLIAATLKDNNIATVIGLPTGMRPYFYYYRLAGALKNSQFLLYISNSRVRSSSDIALDDDYIKPDIWVPTSYEDIVVQRNPQLEKMREIADESDDGIVWIQQPARPLVQPNFTVDVDLEKLGYTNLHISDVKVKNTLGHLQSINSSILDGHLLVRPVHQWQPSMTYRLYIPGNTIPEKTILVPIEKEIEVTKQVAVRTTKKVPKVVTKKVPQKVTLVVTRKQVMDKDPVISEKLRTIFGIKDIRSLLPKFPTKNASMNDKITLNKTIYNTVKETIYVDVEEIVMNEVKEMQKTTVMEEKVIPEHKEGYKIIFTITQ